MIGRRRISGNVQRGSKSKLPSVTLRGAWARPRLTALQMEGNLCEEAQRTHRDIAQLT